MQPLRFDDFQFLEEEQIDANIECALTQQEIQMAVEEVLPVLNALVSSLLGWLAVQPHLNPLKPESFVYALRETLREHVPSDEARAPADRLLRACWAWHAPAIQGSVGMAALTGWIGWSRTHAGPASGAASLKPSENSVARTMADAGQVAQKLLSSVSSIPGP